MSGRGIPLGDDLLDAVGILEWASMSPTLTNWNQEYVQSLRASFAKALSDTPANVCDDLADSFELLPTEFQVRFLRAPEVSRRIIPWKDGSAVVDVAALSRLMLATLVEAGVVEPTPTPLWTARGDKQAHERSASPVGETLPVQFSLDQRSPYKIPDIDRGGNTITFASESDVADSVARLAIACEDLRLLSPAFDLLQQNVEVVAIRAEIEEPTIFSSGTFSRHIGLVLLTNAHLPNVDRALLMNALVHEAIHCILFIHEVIRAPFLLQGPLAAQTVISPWSGAALRLHSYIEACFVWFGLFWLWTRFPARSLAERERSDQLRARAFAGFKHRPVTRILANERENIARHVWDALESIESRICDSNQAQPQMRDGASE